MNLRKTVILDSLDFAAQAVRTGQFGDLLRTVPLRRLRYPRDYAALPSVLAAVEADAEKLA